ncbi:immune inhibitor A domain-containing protein [Shewanella sp. KT0246]|uniref:immune inhibitor A domain-containing protein n=1 Tax=Shewanella sp. KT0246 TaxID=2815912 RepID=UPI001BBE0E73|nr:immune inhibitor A domain-containing protein [Shewanella sp. KT0246]GIU52400.1 peptidase M6 [Shewanella sp. KT0246]
MANKFKQPRTSLITPVALSLAALFSVSSIAAPIKHTSPADAGVINPQQIIYWLTKRGELSVDASDGEKQIALQNFTRKARANNHAVPAEQTKRVNQIARTKQQQNASSVVAFADSDIKKAVNVLAVLVDFPDLPYNDNRLTSADTGMYYSNYSVEHYEDILFSKTGFTGPNGENLETAFQYFDQASGETFTFDGEVKGWVTADNNAAFYGGNDANNNDDDKAAPELVMEAVTKAVAGMTTAELAQYDIEDPYDINNNGNLDEPDGIIDHIVIFHSSVGEEAGGGVLGTDAIWSHRYYVGVSTFGSTLPGTSMKVYGYTVQPIDSATGVITHEFGHDLGLPDEYDTSGTAGSGSPVGSWSLMSGGSWVGQETAGNYIAGTRPSGFSPYARSYLQQRYKGKWVNEQTINWADIGETGFSADLVSAVNADAVNQLSIALPTASVDFKQPLTGEYQYHSGKGHLMTNTMNFNLDVPEGTPLLLSFQAHWDIEVDYDYTQVLINGVAIEGNHTAASNPLYSNVSHYISGLSSDISSASGADSWVELTYDLAAYAGQNVQVEINYITDEAVGGYGIAIDDIALTHQGSVVYQDGAESADAVTLDGFARIDDSLPGLPQRYIVQLRNYQGIDEGLANIGYESGVLLWLENENYEDNNVTEHAGYGLIGLVDADQNLITNGSTDVQIRDASFSLYPQTTYPSDAHLSNISLFDDSRDYSAPLQPQSGMILRELGLTMNVTAQSTNSDTATVEFKRSVVITDPGETSLEASFDVVVSDYTAVFTANAEGGEGDYIYAWAFGEAGVTSTLANPTHTYTSSDGFVVTLTVTDSAGETATYSRIVEVVIPIAADFDITIVGDNDMTVRLTNNTSGGFGDLNYSWDMGDGNTVTGENPADYTYAADGSYTILLTVTDEKGNQHLHAVSLTFPIVVTEENVDSGDSSGGSLGWFTLLILSLLTRNRLNIKRKI